MKLADKIANVSDIDGAPPAGWSIERKREYFDWSKQVVDRMRGMHAALESRFDAEFQTPLTAQVSMINPSFAF